MTDQAFHAPPGFHIRGLQATDRADWDRLWQGYLTFYKASVSIEATEMTWQRLLTPGLGHDGLVAVAPDGSLVGLAHYLFHYSSWEIEPRCYLQDLFVAPVARGNGLGGHLIDAVYVMADRAGSGRVWWLTHESNATAIELYDKVAQRSGFIQYRRK